MVCIPIRLTHFAVNSGLWAFSFFTADGIEIRPITQELHLFEGQIGADGRFTQVGLDTLIDSFYNPINQRNFSFRIKDAEALRHYAPLLHKAMAGTFWNFRMAVHMHESGCFQHNDWKAKFFLWTTAVEALFTTKANQGSVVASERIKFFLGAKTLIYPPGELVSLYPDPKLTVEDVVGELYCLRNHIAHGDRVPDYYFQTAGRPGPLNFGGDLISRCDMLFEAISFIIRYSLLRVLNDNLLDSFADGDATDAYFAQHGLTTAAFRAVKALNYPCPK